jgi:hypothetical protein
MSNKSTYETGTEMIQDEFAHPELHQYPPPPATTERFKRQFGEMPVFPIGMVGFVSMAAYGENLQSAEIYSPSLLRCSNAPLID